MDILLILAIALAIDIVLGEPPRLIHPVVWMGKITSFLAKGSNGRSPFIQFVYGMGISLFLIGLFAASTYFILYYLKSLNFVAYVIVGAVLLKSAFSLKELRRVALRVKELLLRDELDKAHHELRSLVSRDTQGLPKPLVVSATVESVAENTCDSFVAPLFYFLLFGVPGAITYRVINTLDAMVGYHGRYEYLGKFASKLDDVLNFIPARLTALLLVLASFLSGRDARASWQVAFSEHSKTESPNAGWTMSAMAGALRTRLEKKGCYTLGDSNNPLLPQLIGSGVRLLDISALLWVCLIMGVMFFVFIA